MQFTISIEGRQYEARLDAGCSIALRLNFDKRQPNLFGVPPASATAVQRADFLGDTRRGGSCNVGELNLIPHCHGTHTESVGHIIDEPLPIADGVGTRLMLAVVVSVTPARLGETSHETYPYSQPYDRVICRQSLADVLAKFEPKQAEPYPAALVIRTLPNDEAKRTAQYVAEPVPPYFTIQAMQAITVSRYQHLIVDLPSIDRIFDRGQLANHHIYWDVAPASRQVSKTTRCDRTITEFTYVPNEVPDGLYLLSLQVPDLACDAVPSRPVLYPLQERNAS